MPEETNESVDTRSTDELDKLADSSDVARNSERPMSAKEEPAAAAPWKEDSFEHGGKTVKGTREQILKWAQMGYDRPQVMQKFNKEREAWNQEKQKWETNWSKYRAVDEYFDKNPQQWGFWQDAFQRQFSPSQTPGTAIAPAIGATSPAPAAPQANIAEMVQKAIQGLPIFQELLQDKVSRENEAQDRQLEQDVQSVRERYKDLDWDSLDENGKSLELKVLEHAHANGIQNFVTAFKDLLHDELVSRAEAQGKIAVSKGIQAKTKLGVLGQVPTPSKGFQRNKSIRNTSYEELAEEAKEEVRQLSRA